MSNINNNNINSLAYQQQSLPSNTNVTNQQQYMLQNQRLNNQILAQQNQQQIYNQSKFLSNSYNNLTQLQQKQMFNNHTQNQQQQFNSQQSLQKIVHNPQLDYQQGVQLSDNQLQRTDSPHIDFTEEDDFPIDDEEVPSEYNKLLQNKDCNNINNLFSRTANNKGVKRGLNGQEDGIEELNLPLGITNPRSNSHLRSNSDQMRLLVNENS
jgi:hypothetical protein